MVHFFPDLFNYSSYHDYKVGINDSQFVRSLIFISMMLMEK